MPLLHRIRRALTRTGCTAPVTADAGVLPCVSTAGPTHPGVCDDHLAWRSFEIPLRILFALKPWWPNELGRDMDRAGRERRAAQVVVGFDGSGSSTFATLVRRPDDSLHIEYPNEVSEGHDHSPLISCAMGCPALSSRGRS